jgi:hypothetical protein
MRRKATLISRDTKDGWDYIRDEVPLGKVYYADMSTVALLLCENTALSSKLVKRECVKVYDTLDGDEGGFMPMELLEIEADA